MVYSRFTNPTVAALQERLAALEGGEMALATASGMSAITLTFLHFLKSGDSIVAHPVLYGGTCEFLFHMARRYGIEVRSVDFQDPKKVEAAIDRTTKLIYFESPTNPLLEVIDIRKITRIAKKHKVISVFDNTFAPPPLQFPLKLGVDIVIHSLTKYIGGHSDLIGGAIIGSNKLMEPLFAHSYIFFGPTMSPFTAYLALRGLTTLEVRLKKETETTQKIVKYLKDNPKVKKVNYPGFGAVLSFDLKGGYKAGEKLVNAVKVITLAVSLGGVESLIEHPASMTHSELTPEERKQSGIGEGLIRIAVGLEDEEDLIKDLKQAFSSI
jgi:methionine-gamma-lyase